MKNKEYLFLSGMYRSGNTLLSSILNQNPEIYSSPLSPLCEHAWNSYCTFLNNENDIRIKNKDYEGRIIKGLFENFYQDIEKPYIFDRDKNWATPPNLEILKKYITPTPKIIFTVRPLLECAASYINILGDAIETLMVREGWLVDPEALDNDVKCDFVLRPNSPIMKNLQSFYSIYKEENKKIIHLVEYSDIVQNPRETMNKIYNFLELPNFKHNFDSIEKIEKEDDSSVFKTLYNIDGVGDLHKINPKLKKSSTEVDKFFSNSCIKKYENYVNPIRYQI